MVLHHTQSFLHHLIVKPISQRIEHTILQRLVMLCVHLHELVYLKHARFADSDDILHLGVLIIHFEIKRILLLKML